MRGRAGLFFPTMNFETIISVIKEQWEVLTFLSLCLLMLWRSTRKKIPLIKSFWSAASALRALEQTVKDRLENLEHQISYNRGRTHILTDLLQTPIWIANNKGQFIYINPSFCEYFGRDEDELLGAGWLAICSDKDVEKLLNLYTNMIHSQTRGVFEFYADTVHGHKKVRMSCHIMPDREGLLNEFHGSLKGIQMMDKGEQ